MQLTATGPEKISGSFTKTLLIMKLTALLIFATILQVSANTEATAQVTLKEKSAPLEKVLKAIKKQSAYDLFFDEALVRAKGKPVVINVDNVPVEEALSQVFKTQDQLTYTLTGRIISVQEKKLPITQGLNSGLIPSLPTPPVDIKGKVTNDKGEPVEGASVVVKGTNKGTTTNAQGLFTLMGVEENAVLVISAITIETKEVFLNRRTDIAIITKAKINTLTDVDVTVSTGYQTIPKERATGSFDHINNELFNRRVSSDVISRLEGISSSVIFNSNLPAGSNESIFSIRGRSTIFANTKPLIILDNFPFEGDLNNINPNDVESVTILKDAAATSIWGARAGNGVVVINSKKGKLNNPLQIELNTNLTIGQKPDLFYSPNFLNSSDFIDVEQFLFSKGYFDATITNTTTRPVISPVVEILAKQRAGTITAADATAQINALRGLDDRNDFSKYFYQKAINQQYSLSFHGGSDKASYQFSLGTDNNLTSLVNNNYKRYTISSSNSFYPLKNVEFSVSANYVETQTTNNNQGIAIQPGQGKGMYYPYAQFVSASGEATAVTRDYRYAFIDTASQNKLLDWRYRPYDELRLANNKTNQYYVRFNPSIKINLINGLVFQLKYNYEKQYAKSYNLQGQQTYFVRNLINLYSQINAASIAYPIPVGDILDRNNSELTHSSLRTQLDFNRSFRKHNFAAIAGFETRQLDVRTNQDRLYGYNDIVATSTPIDYVSLFSKYQSLASASKVPYINGIGSTTDKFISYFANAAYTYNNRYGLSLSGRIDQSNLFGVETNQKSVPLYSAGLSWDINKEKFFKNNIFSLLKIRATFGYSGNIDKSVTAYTTGSYSGASSVTGAQTVTILNPPNPALRWERISMTNFGVDFKTANHVLSGSIEYYRKSGKDLIGFNPTDPTTGFTQFKGNTANIQGQGWDIELTSNNLHGSVKWITTLLFSKSTDKVTDYNITTTVGSYLQTNDGLSVFPITPIVGRPVYSVFGYRWAGLDPSTGDPQGYLNGQVSKDYASMANSKNLSDLYYAGSARPTIFGSLRNDFVIKNFSVSVNILYKIGYFFRRPSVNYTSLYANWIGNPEYSSRWKKPGDELITNIPSMPYPLVAARESFYQYSQVLIEKGDHIRLQDIQISYDFNMVKFKTISIRHLQLYLYANNLGILWKATNAKIDPDFINSIPNPKQISFGLKINP